MDEGTVGILLVIFVNVFLEDIAAARLTSGGTVKRNVLVDDSAAKRSAARGQKRKLKEGNHRGEEIVGVLYFGVDLVGAGDDVWGIILADAEVVGALSLADPEVVVDLIDTGGGGVVIYV